MKAEFEKYLMSIGMTEALIERVEKVHGFYEEICPDEIVDIFVSEYIKEDESREYENLWFFSSKYCMEAHDFVTRDFFDIELMKTRITFCEIHKQDYDFKRAIKKSRIRLRFNLSRNREGTIKASGQNCDYLKNIFLKYILPNFVE